MKKLEKFCPKCGKETDELYEGLCKECFKSEKKVIEIPEKINITICPKCGRLKKGRKWKTEELKEFVKKEIKRIIEIEGEIKEIKFDFKELENGLKVEIKVKTYLINNMLSESRKIVKIGIKKERCKYCEKRLSGYYETVIQLRSEDNKKINKALKIIKNIIKGLEDNMGFVSNIRKVKNGYDLFIGSKGLGNRISKKIKKELNAEKKDSYTLTTRKEGKDIYKTTILLSF